MLLNSFKLKKRVGNLVIGDERNLKILVIEDNKGVCSMIEMFFAKEGIEGEFVNDGLEGYNRFKQSTWDALIVDWMLPGMDGVTLCRKIREEKNTVPIIMLTAKDSESDQVLGLEMGADDYVTKPFSPLALMARIKAVTRRFNNLTSDPEESGVIKSEHIKINKNMREVLIDGEAITNLTPKEFDLLYYFVQHPKQVFSREQLLERVWGYQFYGDERTVDVHIKRLRKKIETATQPFFHTVWGVGYKFDETHKTDEV
jgi:two-component system, OmpR family, response regulator